jgi:hypothetical protein
MNCGNIDVNNMFCNNFTCLFSFVIEKINKNVILISCNLLIMDHDLRF